MANFLELSASADDAKAIESLMNKAFAAKGISVNATNSGTTLKILLKNAHYPQQQLSDTIKNGLNKIHPCGFDQVILEAEKTDSTAPWREQWSLNIDKPFHLELPAGESVECDTIAPSINKQQWYQQTWLIIIFLICMPMIGIPMTWLSRWPQRVKLGASAASACLLLFATVSSPSSTEVEATQAEQAAEQVQSTTRNSELEDTEISFDGVTGTTNPESVADPSFGEAIRAATRASEATQSAQTAEQWTSVAADWQQAIDLLGSVPESDANYASAQIRIPEYSSNLDYAQTNATRLSAPVAHPAFGEAIRAATRAAEATQSARTTEQWNNVVEFWEQAIDSLRKVPSSDVNHTTAQAKIQEYTSNLEYARSNATALTPEDKLGLFRALVRRADPNGLIVTDVQYRPGTTDTVDMFIPEIVWDVMDLDTRKDVLKNWYDNWVGIHSPNNRDAARLRLMKESRSGAYQVGGSQDGEPGSSHFLYTN